MRNTLNRLSNLFVGSVLASPLHGLLSREFMVITVTGRRTGRRYSTPVQYRQNGDTLTVFTRAERTWWKNLRGGAPVTLRLRGHTVRATADAREMTPDEAMVALQAAYPRMTVAQAAQLAPGSVRVLVQLASESP